MLNCSELWPQDIAFKFDPENRSQSQWTSGTPWVNCSMQNLFKAGQYCMQFNKISVFKVDGEQWPTHNNNTVGELMATGRQSTLTRSYRQIDSRTVEFVSYNNGVAGARKPGVRSVSPDGQTMMLRTYGTNAMGDETTTTWFFNRVRWIRVFLEF